MIMDQTSLVWHGAVLDTQPIANQVQLHLVHFELLTTSATDTHDRVMDRVFFK